MATHFWKTSAKCTSFEVSSLELQVSVSKFLMKSRSRLKILTRSRSQPWRLRSRLHHWSIVTVIRLMKKIFHRFFDLHYCTYASHFENIYSTTVGWLIMAKKLRHGWLHIDDVTIGTQSYFCPTRNFSLVAALTGFVHHRLRYFVKMTLTRVSSHWLWKSSHSVKNVTRVDSPSFLNLLEWSSSHQKSWLDSSHGLE